MALYLFRRVERAGPAPETCRRLAGLMLVVVAAVGVARVLQIYVGPAVCKVCRLQAPYADAARAMATAGFAGRGTVLADDEYLAGNLRARFPEARVLAARFPLFRPAHPGSSGQCLVTWNVARGPAAPPRLVALARQALGIDLGGAAQPLRFEAVLPYSDTAIASRRTLALAYLLPAESVVNCR